jgi:hypothetical protein
MSKSPMSVDLISVALGHSATLHSHFLHYCASGSLLHHILSALVVLPMGSEAAQSPYTGYQNIVNSQNIKQHWDKILLEKQIMYTFSYSWFLFDDTI